ncbi:MAG: hypothetical protein JSS82_00035 [Bacteroidetes bacterium]|nr:hypothetical protein [Bacteroidota bacterium]
MSTESNIAAWIVNIMNQGLGNVPTDMNSREELNAFVSQHAKLASEPYKKGMNGEYDVQVYNLMKQMMVYCMHHTMQEQKNAATFCLGMLADFFNFTTMLRLLWPCSDELLDTWDYCNEDAGLLYSTTTVEFRKMGTSQVAEEVYCQMVDSKLKSGCDGALTTLTEEEYDSLKLYATAADIPWKSLMLQWNLRIDSFMNFAARLRQMQMPIMEDTELSVQAMTMHMERIRMRQKDGDVPFSDILRVMMSILEQTKTTNTWPLGERLAIAFIVAKHVFGGLFVWRKILKSVKSEWYQKSYAHRAAQDAAEIEEFGEIWELVYNLREKNIKIKSSSLVGKSEKFIHTLGEAIDGRLHAGMFMDPHILFACIALKNCINIAIYLDHDNEFPELMRMASAVERSS